MNLGRLSKVKCHSCKGCIKDRMIVSNMNTYHHSCYQKEFGSIDERESKREDKSNKPLPNQLDAYTRMRYGQRCMLGAEKYDKENYKKPFPDSESIESLHRHLGKYELGDRSEDHLSAIIFNVQSIMLNEQRKGIEFDHYKSIE